MSFLERCQRSLRAGGVVCVKDNCYYTADESVDGKEELFYVDRDDSSVTRSARYLEEVFRLAGMKALLVQEQRNFPEELFPVQMYAFIPS